MGFVGPEKASWLEHARRRRSTRAATSPADDDYMTNVPGVFVAGDMGRGQSLIVWAIAEGRACAAGVDRWLMGDTQLPSPISPDGAPTCVTPRPSLTPDEIDAGGSGHGGGRDVTRFGGVRRGRPARRRRRRSSTSEPPASSPSPRRPSPRPIPTTAPDQPGSILEFESEYTIVEGDLPSTVSAKFKVDFQEFLDLNGFVLEGQFVPLWPPVGSVVKIPPGATVPGEPPVGAATTLAPGTATTLAPEATKQTLKRPIRPRARPPRRPSGDCTRRQLHDRRGRLPAARSPRSSTSRRCARRSQLQHAVLLVVRASAWRSSSRA